MVIEYKIKGITLSVSDLIDIDRYYEAACTAEYLLDNYEQVTTEEQAMELGYEVRRKMDKYGYSEEDAIDEVLAEYATDDEDDDECEEGEDNELS